MKNLIKKLKKIFFFFFKKKKIKYTRQLTILDLNIERPLEDYLESPNSTEC